MSDMLETIQSHCNECGHKTNHRVVFCDTVEGSEGDIDDQEHVQWCTKWRLLKCLGCDDVSLEKRFWFSENCADGWDDPEYYPPRVARSKPRWFERLPDEYKGLLNEIYKALQADGRRLAMMGARAIIDTFIQKKVGDKGNFEKGMEALRTSGFISTKNEEIIKAAIDAGNASAHRAYN